MLSRFLRPGSQKITATVVFLLFLALVATLFILYPRDAPARQLPPLLTLTGKFHPLFLHVPIGILLGALVLDLCNGTNRRHESAVTLLLWIGFIFGAKAVAAGYLLSLSGGYAADTLNWHLWFGISIPVLTYLTLMAKLHYQQKQPLMSPTVYRVPLFSTAAALMMAGHFGGNMTHGDILAEVRRTFVRSAIPATGPGAADRTTVYEAVIAPLMERKCNSCHGTEKQKGDLQLHTAAAMLLAGESGKPAILPGNSAGSESIVRAVLPESHDDHMPPEGKPQLTSDELAVLQWWVDAGASPDHDMGDATIPASMREKILALSRSAPPESAPGAEGEEGAAGPEGTPAAAPDMAPVEALEKELGVTILPLAQNDPGLSFNCVNVADKFGDAELAKFAPLAERLTELNLARSKVSDAGLAALSGMKNLKRLNLANTEVGDAGLDFLLGLPKLEYLNLFSTKITDAGLAKLEKLASLKRLYVWQTGATKPAAEALHGKLPDIIINLGWDQEVRTPMVAVVAEEAPVAAAAPAEMDPEQPVFTALIQPVLAAKCTNCHGEEKSKGKLRMHTFEAIMANGDSGEATVVPGKSGDSLIIKRALLPLEEDEHMPPSNKDQLTEKELELLKWWIDQGAKTDVKLKDANLPDNLK